MPLTLHRILDMHIRADKGIYALRSQIKLFEFCAAGRNEDTCLAHILKEKIQREHIYGGIAQLTR